MEKAKDEKSKPDESKDLVVDMDGHKVLVVSVGLVETFGASKAESYSEALELSSTDKEVRKRALERIRRRENHGNRQKAILYDKENI